MKLEKANLDVVCGHCGELVKGDRAAHVCNAERDRRREKFKALIDTAEISLADICSVAGRTREGELLFYAVYATGEAAGDLEYFMASQAEPEEQASAPITEFTTGGFTIGNEAAGEENAGEESSSEESAGSQKRDSQNGDS